MKKCKLCEEEYPGHVEKYGGYCSKLCRMIDMEDNTRWSVWCAEIGDVCPVNPNSVNVHVNKREMQIFLNGSDHAYSSRYSF